MLFGWRMLKDNMQEMPSNVLLYGVPPADHRYDIGLHAYTQIDGTSRI